MKAVCRCGKPLRKIKRGWRCDYCGYFWELPSDNWNGVTDNVERLLEDRVSKCGW